MKGKFALALLLTCAHACAHDLMYVLHKAQAGDPAWRAAINSLDAMRERVPQARAGLLPAVGLIGGSNQQRAQTSFAEAPYQARDARNWNWALQLSQPIWRPVGRAGLAQAEQQEQLAREQLQLAGQDLLLRVAQTYLAALASKENEQVAVRQASAIEQQLVLARRNFEVGAATVTDVHEALSRLDLARSQAFAAKGEMENRNADLNRLAGMQLGDLTSLRESSVTPRPEPESLAIWVDSARSGSRQVRASLVAVAAAEDEISKARAGHLPTFDLTASYGTNASSGSISSPADIATRYRSGQVGITMSMPLFSGGGTQSRVREAVALKAKAEDDLEAARRQAAAQAQQAFTGVMSGLAQIDALASAIRSSRGAVEANKIGYRIGTRINTDVLNAEQQFYSAQRDWNRARVETLMHGLRLKASNASLAEADLQSINDMLETAPP